MAHRTTPFYPPRKQRGAALLTAMIIVTLVATLAAAMVWQQWRAVQVESAERARAQAAWILSGAVDFAGLILREDGKNAARTGGPTALTEPWATPLEESRISTFLAVDKSNADDGPEAFLSGNVTDAQGRYNLRNLVSPTGTPDPLEVATLERLCLTLGIEAGIADRIAQGLSDAVAASTGAASSSSSGSSSTRPLMPESVVQLTWLGIDPASVQALQPYVVILREATKLNVNTTSKEVLAAVIKELDVASAARLVQMSQRTPFKDLNSFSAQAGASIKLPVNLGTQSSYFEVRARLRLADRVLVQRSLVFRGPTAVVTVLRSERVASLEQLAG